MISDTTIAAVKTQGCDMKDKFKAEFSAGTSGGESLQSCSSGL